MEISTTRIHDINSFPPTNFIIKQSAFLIITSFVMEIISRLPSAKGEQEGGFGGYYTEREAREAREAWERDCERERSHFSNAAHHFAKAVDHDGKFLDRSFGDHYPYESLKEAYASAKERVNAGVEFYNGLTEERGTRDPVTGKEIR